LKVIDPLEQDITDFLASDVDLLHNVEPTKRLSDLKKSYDEAVDRFELCYTQIYKNILVKVQNFKAIFALRTPKSR
jgi:hypothetical protein